MRPKIISDDPLVPYTQITDAEKEAAWWRSTPQEMDDALEHVSRWIDDRYLPHLRENNHEGADL